MGILKKSAVTAPVVVPTLSEASPEFAGLIAKQRELEARQRQIESEIHGIKRGRAPAGVAAHAARGRGGRAAALLGDVADGDYTVGPSAAEVEEHLGELRQELGDVEAALAILKVRRPILHNEASKLVCDTVRPGYDQAIRRVALALAPALVAHRELLRITGELNENDIKWSGQLSQPTSLRRSLGEPWEGDAAPHRFIADAVAAGFVTAVEIEGATHG